MNETPSQKPTPLLDEELAHELRETAATFARLGTTVVGLPLALLPDRQREQVRKLKDEVVRMTEILPRTVGAMLEETTDDKKRNREDLGSRLRREERKAAREARRAERQSLNDALDAGDE